MIKEITTHFLPTFMPEEPKIDKDILEALKAEGKGYQTRINKILRDAVLGA